jgi:hypothetical protein
MLKYIKNAICIKLKIDAFFTVEVCQLFKCQTFPLVSISYFIGIFDLVFLYAKSLILLWA